LVDERIGAIRKKSKGHRWNGLDNVLKLFHFFMELVYTQLVSCPEQCKKNQHAESAKPGCLVKCRSDRKCQFSGRIVPDAVTIRSHDME